MKTEPTEALELKKSIQYGLGIIDAGSGILSELSSMVDDVVNIAFSEGQSSTKIKKLEWDFYGLYYDIETAVGHYMILQGDEQYLESYNTCTLTHNGNLIADFNSIDEAKSAAQRDFEKRIKECLE